MTSACCLDIQYSANHGEKYGACAGTLDFVHGHYRFPHHGLARHCRQDKETKTETSKTFNKSSSSPWFIHHYGAWSLSASWPSAAQTYQQSDRRKYIGQPCPELLPPTSRSYAPAHLRRARAPGTCRSWGQLSTERRVGARLVRSSSRLLLREAFCDSRSLGHYRQN
jgi:hypothetical protein